MELSSVQVIESCLVVPRDATPTKGMWLSAFDLTRVNLGHTPIVCLYRSAASSLDVARLKEALAKALVAFYPLAGRLGVDDNGRVEIRCNGEGALFVVARSRCLTAEDIDFSKPSPEFKSQFVPSIEPEAAPLLLAIQVTFLRCGAVMLGGSMHHAVADGISLSHFLQTWSALYRDGDDDNRELPCHDHTLLRARCPPVVHPDTLSVVYWPKAKSPLTEPTTTVTEVFPISRDQLRTLKRLCGGATSASSTFLSLSALVWQCMSVMRGLPPNATTRLGFPANIRRHVRPPLPARYFGNAVITLCATGAAGDIASEALPSVAARIGGAMARIDDELVRSAIDYFEMAQEDSMPPSREDLPETDLRIVSWLNMPVDLDLGCGGSQVVTSANNIDDGRVYLIDDYDGPAANRGGVGVLVRMEPAKIEEFKGLLYATIAKQPSKL